MDEADKNKYVKNADLINLLLESESIEGDDTETGEEIVSSDGNEMSALNSITISQPLEVLELIPISDVSNIFNGDQLEGIGQSQGAGDTLEHTTNPEEEDLKCKYCNNIFLPAALLEKQTCPCLKRDEEASRTCNTCYMIFASKGHLSKHMLSHPITEKYRCARCYRKFNKECKYKMHQQMHQIQNRLSAETEAGIMERLGKKMFVVEFTCTYCGFHFVVPYEKGSVKQRYACDACVEKICFSQLREDNKGQVRFDTISDTTYSCLQGLLILEAYSSAQMKVLNAMMDDYLWA